jgi:hypothetical protein
MSNEIILFLFLYRSLKYLFFSFMKMRIIKFIQCEPCFSNAPIFFEFFYSTIMHLIFVTWYILYKLTNKVFVIKILGQKKLFRNSIWAFHFIFLWNKVLYFF